MATSGSSFAVSGRLNAASTVALACIGIVVVVAVTTTSRHLVLGLPWPFTASWLAIAGAACLG